MVFVEYAPKSIGAGLAEAATTPAKYIFLDVVGFTRNRSVEAQSDIVELLNSLVSSCLSEYDLSEDKRILLPTGDGLCVALLNIEDPYDIHILLALDVLEALSKHNSDPELDEMRKFKIRIGISANTDNLVTDINGNPNIAGRGINEAQRVMDTADGGQILISQAVYNTLRDREKYMDSFAHYSTKVKHGEQLIVYQLKMENTLGLNSEIPIVFRSPPKQEQKQPRLNRRLAFYMAHAIKNQRTVLDNDLWDDNAVILLLYFLAKDSEEEAYSTELDTIYPDTYKFGEADFEEQYGHYAQIDRNVIFTLERFISKHYFYNNSVYKYFHSARGGWTDFRFVSEAGKHKLKEDWPYIWESFELDEGKPKPG